MCLVVLDMGWVQQRDQDIYVQQEPCQDKSSRN